MFSSDDDASVPIVVSDFRFAGVIIEHAATPTIVPGTSFPSYSDIPIACINDFVSFELCLPPGVSAFGNPGSVPKKP